MTVRLPRAALAALALGVSFVASAAVAPAAAQTAERVLAKGTWAKKMFDSSGTWSIVERGGKTVVVLSADFRTQKAPDLKLFLSPLRFDALDGENAVQGALLIAPLGSNSGAQEYELPAGVDLSSYATIIIHCERYAKLWSVGDL